MATNKYWAILVVFVLITAPAFANASITQKNNFCTTTTEKQPGSFRQVIDCNYWRNGSNQSQMQTLSGGSYGGGSDRAGFGMECRVGEFLNYTTWQCEAKTPPLPKLSPDTSSPHFSLIRTMVGVVLVLASVAVLVLVGLLLDVLLSKKKRESRGAK